MRVAAMPVHQEITNSSRLVINLPISESSELKLQTGKESEPKIEQHSNHTVYATEENLSRFVDEMKKYVNDTSFDVFGFENHLEVFKSEFLKIAQSIKRDHPPRNVKKQFSFAKYMFKLMSDANDDLKYYRYSDVPGHQLVSKIIELNVRAMAFFDSHGKLDLSMDNYITRIYKLHRTLYVFFKKYSSLSDVLSDMLLIVNSQVAEAESTLDELWSMVPNEEKKDIDTE
ncbi:hypothetical protein OXX69_007759 [Metschnikowia pulcherrima]